MDEQGGSLVLKAVMASGATGEDKRGGFVAVYNEVSG